MTTGPALTLSAVALLEAPFFPDMVRLAAARRRSLRAAEIAPLAPDDLAAIPTCAWEMSRAAIRPSIQVVASSWPILSLWEGRADATGGSGPGEDVLVVRRDGDAVMRRLPPGGAAFVGALRRGATFAQARAAASQVPGFDLVEVLAVLFSEEVFSDLECPR